ncbi:hypothetical protein NliqN6_1910 [Naganishia liquefaciens]|uniref:Thioredoxin domain-containing protein n=1 Tax=Naganishia liquefaciens TaxID=104408 RepID=A0A8H3YDS0_9TREE|nr:hypothetical protein NliqN6_1910 [Naganishia liquefaciens]
MSPFRHAFQTATNASKIGARRLHASARTLEYYPAVDAKTFTKQVENGSGIVLVDFYATWCNPCKMLTPILKKVAEQKNVDLVTVDVDENSEIAAKYQIRAMPTVIAFKDGKQVNQFMGALPEPHVKKFVEGL